MQIKVILWDIDGTLLNFEAAERLLSDNVFRLLIWASAQTKCLVHIKPLIESIGNVWR